VPDSRARASGLLALARVSNLPTIWMNVLAALVLSGAALRAESFLLLAASLSAFYCAGMCLNDLFDREHDARHQPFRPIPSGRVSVDHARAMALALVLAAEGLLLLAPHPSSLAAGLVLLALILAYDRFHKQLPATALLMGGCRAMAFFVPAWAVTGRLAAGVLLAVSVQFAYTLLVTLVSRAEASREGGFGFPVIPRMIAGMSVLDGVVLAILVQPLWLLPGVAAAFLTHVGQRYVRGT
jgi:4-hydroxybenzoate polyprenyltransferase